jgi:hypothetical protein
MCQHIAESNTIALHTSYVGGMTCRTSCRHESDNYRIALSVRHAQHTMFRRIRRYVRAVRQGIAAYLRGVLDGIPILRLCDRSCRVLRGWLNRSPRCEYQSVETAQGDALVDRHVSRNAGRCYYHAPALPCSACASSGHDNLSDHRAMSGCSCLSYTQMCVANVSCTHGYKTPARSGVMDVLRSSSRTYRTQQKPACIAGDALHVAHILYAMQIRKPCYKNMLFEPPCMVRALFLYCIANMVLS